jgi:thymidylate synthase
MNSNPEEVAYLDIVRQLVAESFVATRAEATTSVIGAMLKFTLRLKAMPSMTSSESSPAISSPTAIHIPILSSKKIAVRAIIWELLWFLRAEQDTKYLDDHKVGIWAPNSTVEFLESRGIKGRAQGHVGPIYGVQWRRWPSTTQVSNNRAYIDQLSTTVDLMLQDPTSRRLVVSAWNPDQLHLMALPPCHYSFQIIAKPVSLVAHTTSVDKTPRAYAISLQFNMRSADICLGVPFNIVSYSILLQLVCTIATNKSKLLHKTDTSKYAEMTFAPETVIASMCDVHMYESHATPAKVQLQSAVAGQWPTLCLSARARAITSFDEAADLDAVADFAIDYGRCYADGREYNPPIIKYKMVA